MSEDNFTWNPPVQHLVMWWMFDLFIFLGFWPQDSTNLYNSPDVILGESLAIQTLLLTVH